MLRRLRWPFGRKTQRAPQGMTPLVITMAQQERGGVSRHEDGPECPRCSSRWTASAFYGYPRYSTLADAREGRVALAGCCLDEVLYNWHCFDCNLWWHGWPGDDDEPGEPDVPGAQPAGEPATLPG